MSWGIGKSQHSYPMVFSNDIHVSNIFGLISLQNLTKLIKLELDLRQIPY